MLKCITVIHDGSNQTKLFHYGSAHSFIVHVTWLIMGAWGTHHVCAANLRIQSKVSEIALPSMTYRPQSNILKLRHKHKICYVSIIYKITPIFAKIIYIFKSNLMFYYIFLYVLYQMETFFPKVYSTIEYVSGETVQCQIWQFINNLKN